MSGDEIAALIVALLIAGYLVVALIFPERL